LILKIVKVDLKRSYVVINGNHSSFYIGQSFLIFEYGDELFDVVTKESLGELEIVKCKAKLMNLQEKMCTLGLEMVDTKYTYELPIKLGDYAKPL
jgi:hypothetical protein